MTEWISPVDRHRHYGEAGRASCAVCRLEAERDRLRARVLELEGQAGDRERLLRDVLQDMRAERDRLRAVVVATATDARVLVKALGQRNTDAATALAERIYDRHEPYDVGEQLDGSADGTDG